ncbi:MAG TPA: amidohydrolase [Phycisphaerae bacterium]|nr:amidohydrolase [Phycisphaerae bacterium]
MAATLIIHARRILAMGPAGGPQAASVAVHGRRVYAVGTRRQIERLRSRRTTVLDLAGCVVMPAFTDAHTHFHMWAARPDVVNLINARSLADALRRIAVAARQRAPGEWVIARGFDKNHWQQAAHAEAGGRRGGGSEQWFPTAAHLDAVTGSVPTQVQSRDGHSVWVNTAAMRAAGITARTKAPPGGAILRDNRGRPTGILQENAITLLPDIASTLTDAQIERAMVAGIREFHRYGITCAHAVEGAEALRWFGRLHQAGKLGLRIRFAIPSERLDEAIAVGLTNGLGDDMLRICGVKCYADGSLGSQSAYMFDPYPARPGYRGVPVCVGKALRDLVCKAAKAGLPCWVHAIGDRAVHETLEAFAAARRLERRPLRHRIEHAQCVRPADARRMGRLRIIASMQPCHIVGDIEAAETHWSNVLAWTYPIRSLRAAGVPLAFGSDVPVETFDPIVGLHAAVNRQRLDRTPTGGWQMHQAIGIRDALRAYTVGGAYAAGDADSLGRIAPGMLADFAVLSDDPLRIPRERLLDLRVVATVCDGKVVYAST